VAADPLADIDAAGEDLLLLYELADVPALLITRVANQVIVRCQNQGDVLELCRLVVEQYASPSDRTVN
jgi:hypothetical protein